jgi:hypothetical protein
MIWNAKAAATAGVNWHGGSTGKIKAVGRRSLVQNSTSDGNKTSASGRRSLVQNATEAMKGYSKSKRVTGLQARRKAIPTVTQRKRENFTSFVNRDLKLSKLWRRVVRRK